MVKKISISDELHEILKDDRDFFECTIRAGKWSIDRTIREYLKIMPKDEAKILYNGRYMKWSTLKKKFNGNMEELKKEVKRYLESI